MKLKSLLLAKQAFLLGQVDITGSRSFQHALALVFCLPNFRCAFLPYKILGRKFVGFGFNPRVETRGYDRSPLTGLYYDNASKFSSFQLNQDLKDYRISMIFLLYPANPSIKKIMIRDDTPTTTKGL